MFDWGRRTRLPAGVDLLTMPIQFAVPIRESSGNLLDITHTPLYICATVRMLGEFKQFYCSSQYSYRAAVMPFLDCMVSISKLTLLNYFRVWRTLSFFWLVTPSLLLMDSFDALLIEWECYLNCISIHWPFYHKNCSCLDDSSLQDI